MNPGLTNNGCKTRVHVSGGRAATHLVFCVRGQELEGADGEPELVGVRELPHAHAQGHELVARDVGGALHHILPHVEHPLLVAEGGEEDEFSFVSSTLYILCLTGYFVTQSAPSHLENSKDMGAYSIGTCE